MDSISFIIPVYDVKIEDLKKTIKSITKQEFKDYEIILINDGSPDKNLEPNCLKLVKENNNIKYLYQDNSGSAVARNKGLDEATKKYIVFVDADDRLTDNYKELLNSIEEKEFEFVIMDYSVLHQDNEKLDSFKQKTDFIDQKNDIYANIMFYPDKMNNFLFGSIWGKIFLRKYIEENKIRFKPELRKAQDRMFMLNIIYYAKNIIYYPLWVYRYRINEKSITHKINYKMIDYYYELYKRMKDFCVSLDIDSECNKFLQYNIVNELVLLTVFHMDNEKKYKEIKKEYKEIYKKFELKEGLKNIKFKDVPSKKGKVKLFLYKNNNIYILYKFFIKQQKKNRKRMFER